MKINEIITESVNENLHKWFKEKWVRFGPDGKIRGDCARGDDSEGKPKCLPQAKAHAVGKDARASAAARKRRQDPNADRSGKAINVNTKKKTSEGEGDPEGLPHLSKELLVHIVQQIGTEGAHALVKSLEWGDGAAKELLKLLTKDLKQDIESMPAESIAEECPHCGGSMFSELMINEKKDACYYKVKSRYKVWPSAYASGALVKCRNKGAKNWGTKSEGVEEAATPAQQAAIAIAMKKKNENMEQKLSLEEQFDVIEEMVNSLAESRGVDSEVVWECLESMDDNKLYEIAAWQRKAGKNKKGGLNRKGVASYRREHPGSKLQTAVTTKPSKLKPGSKAAKRRKSFCARMGGMPGPMKDEHGKPTRKALSLRKWNC